jgi:hypothetical protein
MAQNHPYIGNAHWPSCDAEVLGDGSLFVDMMIHAGDDLKTKTPNIGIIRDGKVIEMLTWDEANDLATALHNVAGIAENG